MPCGGPCVCLRRWDSGNIPYSYVILCSPSFRRYILPLALLVLLATRWTNNPQEKSPLTTEDTLHATVSDLNTILALIPTLSNKPSVPLPILLRVSAIMYIPYLILTYFVRLRIFLALAGTVLLTWRARWASNIRRGLWRSAWIRWSVYYLWAIISGQPLPPKVLSTPTLAATLGLLPKPVSSIRFLFTIYENQRWWVGLDWTAALLPGERPSWCSASQQPVSPPSAFALPATTIVYMSDGHGARVKRTARWVWEEDEWRVMVHKEGGGSSRVERPLPNPKEEGAAATSASRVLRAAGKMRQSSLSASPERSKEKDESGHDVSSQAPERVENEAEEEPFTDADGWVFADNKWEGGSGKGGMGKVRIVISLLLFTNAGYWQYTRYRRWTRIAVLTETVEPAEPGEVGIRHVEEVKVNPLPHEDTEPVHDTGEPGGESEQTNLRQRLKAAIKGSH